MNGLWSSGAAAWLLVACGLMGSAAGAASPASAPAAVAGVTALADGWSWRAGDDPSWAAEGPEAPGWAPVAAFPHSLPDEWPRSPRWLWYRSRLKVPTAEGPLAIAVGSARFSSIEVYLNGQLAGSKGRIGPDPLITQPGYVILPLPAASLPGEAVEIALRLRALPGYANLDEREVRAGLDLPPLLGSRPALENQIELWQARRSRQRAHWIAVLVICLASFFFHASLARARRAGKECLMFAGMSLLLAVLTWSNNLWEGELFADAVLVRRLGLVAVFWVASWLIRFVALLLGHPLGRFWRFAPLAVSLPSLLLLLPFSDAFHLLVRDLILLPALSLVVLAFGLCLRAGLRGHREARILCLGLGIFLLACISTVALLIFHQNARAMVPIGFIALIVAMTLALGERFKQLSDELDVLNRELENQVAARTSELAGANLRLADSEQAARAASRAKSSFLANMSHEIRTPLTGVLGMTSMLLRSELPEPQRQMVATIHSSGDSLLGILNDVLDFSKIEEARLTLEHRPYSPAKKVREVADLFRPAAEAKGLVLEGELAPDLPAAVLGDPVRLRQILLNLVGNAVKFTERGEVRVRLTAEPLGETRCRLSFEVRDTGVGIAAEDKVFLFQPFSQVEAAQVEGAKGQRQGGTGLGLAISQRLAGLMGGEIEVAGEPGRGSVFTLRLPAERTAAPAPGAAPALVPVPPGLRVLVAEDNPVNREILGLMLQELGAETDFVVTGLAATEAVRQREYEVLLMDVNMPELDGIEATRLIRSDREALGRPHIVALTANAFAEDRLRCLAAGCDDFLPKPLRLEELAASLSALARRAR